MPRALPPLSSLVLRFALVGAVLLTIGGWFATTIVEPLVPGFARIVGVVSSDFTMLDVEVDRSSARPVVFRANLSHAQLVNGQPVYPIGFNGGRAGGYQITMTSGGILQHALLLIIIVMAWPGSWRELALRAVPMVPLAWLLMTQDAVVTLLAELWFPIHDQFARGQFWPLLAYSRFLMGGGGLALAIALAVLVIALARRIEQRLMQQSAQSPLAHAPDGGA